MDYALLELENKLIEIIDPSQTDSKYLENVSNGNKEITNDEQVNNFQIKRYLDPVKMFVKQDNITIGTKASDIDIRTINNLDKLIFDTSNMLLFADTSMSVFKNYSRITNKYIKYQVGDVFHFSTYLCIKVSSDSNYKLIVFDRNVVKVNVPSIGKEKDSHTYNKHEVISEKEMCKTVIDLDVPPNNIMCVNLSELIKRLIPTIVSVTLTLVLLRYQSRGLYIYIGIVTTVITLLITVIDFITKKVCYRKQIRDYNTEFDNYIRAKKLSIINAYKFELEQLNLMYPSSMNIINNIEYNDFCGKAGIEDIQVRIGSGLNKSCYQINNKVNEHKPNPSLEESRLLELKQTYSCIANAPIVCSLNNDIGIVGCAQLTYKVVVNILLQLLYFYSSDLLKIVFVMDSCEVSLFYGFTHLKHFRMSNGLYTLVYDQTSLDLVSEAMKLDSISDYITIENCKVNNLAKSLLSKSNIKPVKTVYYTEDVSMLPTGIGCKIIVEDKNKGQVKTIDGVNKDVSLDQCPSKLVLRKAIFNLCKLDDARQSERSELPNKISLFELYGIEKNDQLDLKTRWKNNRPWQTISTVIGKSSNGNLILDLNEAEDGPHGIIVGTTGSGKSELLKTLILSLAINYDPSYVGFVLIDYKGSAMANQLKGLPHILGSTSNLDEKEAKRIIISINSEIKSRQNTFKELNISHIDEYHKLYETSNSKGTIPRLIIICDEFAELKVNNPDFINSLISIARVGRSLGIHLILSTQKVEGVVDSQIISNCNFKIALKVADKIDSRELIGNNKAATIVNKGRGYLVTANNQEKLFQSGYVSSLVNFKASNRLDLIDKYGRRRSVFNSIESKTNQTQMELVIEQIKIYVETHKIQLSKSIWQKPLAKDVQLPKVNLGKFKGHLGIVDIPTMQSQEKLEIDISSCTAIAIVGAAGTGKTNTLKTLLLSLAKSTDSKCLKYYLLGKGNEHLARLEKLQHCAEYISLFDNHSIKLLCNNITQIIEIRQKQGLIMDNEQQHIIVAIDGYDIISTEDTNILKLVDIILNRGNYVGVHLIITCNKFGRIKLDYQSKMSFIIHHYTADKYDLINTFGVSSESVFEEIVGRAIVNRDGLNQLQVYNCNETEEALITEINLKCSHQNKPMARMPKHVKYERRYYKQDRLFIGFDETDIKPCYINYKPLFVYGSKCKTSFILLLLEQLKSKAIIIDDECSTLKGEQGYCEYYHFNQFDTFVSRLFKISTKYLDNDKYVIYINQSHGFSRSSQLLQERFIEVLLQLVKLNIMVIVELSNCFESNKLINIAKGFKQKIYFGDAHNQNVVRFPLNTTPRENDDAFLITDVISEVKVIGIEKTSII